jgi:hypothetical protein
VDTVRATQGFVKLGHVIVVVTLLGTPYESFTPVKEFNVPCGLIKAPCANQSAVTKTSGPVYFGQRTILIFVINKTNDDAQRVRVAQTTNSSVQVCWMKGLKLQRSKKCAGARRKYEIGIYIIDRPANIMEAMNQSVSCLTSRYNQQVTSVRMFRKFGVS